MKTFEEQLRDGLAPTLAPEDELNTTILKHAKEMEFMKGKRLRQGIAAAVAVVAIGSVTAYAAYHFLTPANVAETLTEGTSLSAAFEGSSATLVNETQRTGGYDVTFLGTVTGEDLIPTVEDNGEAEGLSAARTYAVVAIENADGSPMPTTAEEEYQTFCVSALIHGKGFEEANNGILNAGARSFVQDGVQYELYECDDLEIFSGMGVSLGVVENFGDELSAFAYDTATGLYSVNQDYDGINALFDLPLDISKADDEAANAYLEQRSAETTSTEDEFSTGNRAVDDWIAAILEADTSESEAWAAAMETARLDAARTQTVEVDETGSVYFPGQDGEGGEKIWVDGWVDAVGVEVLDGAQSDGTLEGTCVTTLTKNADGTFTLRYYVPITE